MNFKKVLSLMLAFAMIASTFTCMVVKADVPAGYIVYEDYDAQGFHSWTCVTGGTGSPEGSVVEIGEGNYAFNLHAKNSGGSGISVYGRSVGGDDGVALEEGKNVVIESRIRIVADASKIDSNGPRLYFGINSSQVVYLEQAGGAFFAANTYNNIAYNGSDFYGSAGQTTVKDAEGNTVALNEKWFNVKAVMKGVSGKVDLNVTLDDGTVVWDKTDLAMPTTKSGTLMNPTHLKNVTIGAWRNETDVQVDYLRVYKGSPLKVYVPEANSGKNKIEVKLSVDNANLVNAVDFYQADGVTPLSGNKAYDATNKKVEFTPSSTLATGSNVVVKLNNNEVAANGYYLENEESTYTVAIRKYIVNEDYSESDKGSWSIPYGSGSVAYQEVDGAGTAAVTVNNSSSYAEMLVNGGAGITFEEGKNIVLEMRTKRSTADTRLDSKMNMGEIAAFPFYTSNTAKTEWQDVIYGLFRQNNASNSIAVFGSSQTTISDFSATGNTDWITTKVVFKGNSGLADISFTKTLASTGEPLTVTKTDQLLPRAGTVGGTYNDGFTLFDSLNSLSFRIVGNGGAATSTATTNYYDYVRVYEEYALNATVPESVKLKDNITVTFDKDDAGLKDAVKLYNGATEVPATYSYNAGVVTIDPSDKLTEGTNYTVKVDRNILTELGYSIATNEFIVTASKYEYIINEEFSSTSGSWSNLGSPSNKSTVDLGNGNYAYKFTASGGTSSVAGLKSSLNGGEGIAFEEGKNTIIQARVQISGTSAGRLYLGMNYDESGIDISNAGGAIFVANPSNSRVFEGGKDFYSTHYALDGGTGDRWYNITYTINGTGGTDNHLLVTLDDGTEVWNKAIGWPKLGSSTLMNPTVLKTISFGSWYNTSDVQIDYLRVYKETPLMNVTATAPSTVKPTGNIEVTFDKDNAEFKDAVKLYNENKTAEIPATYSYNSGVVTINPNADLTLETDYKVVIDKDILSEAGYIIDINEFNVKASIYVIDEDYSTNAGGWTVVAGSGTATPTTEDGAGVVALTISSNGTHMYHAVNGASGVTFEDGKNVILETRVKRADLNARLMFKMNIGEPLAGTAYAFGSEQADNLYSLFYMTEKTPFANLGDSKYGSIVQTLDETKLLTDANQWLTVKIAFKGTTGKADVTFTNDAGLTRTFTDAIIPVSTASTNKVAGFDAMKSLSFRTTGTGAYGNSASSTTVYLDYLKVYQATPITVTVPSKAFLSDDIKVTFDKDNAGLKDAVKLYNENKTEEIPATYSYNSGVVTINPNSDLAEGTNYTVVIDKNILSELEYGVTTNEFTVTASKYYVNDDYSEGNYGGLRKIDGNVTFYSVTDDFTGAGNYAAKMVSGTDGKFGYAFEGDGIPLESGKNVIIETKVALRGGGSGSRLFFGMNTDWSDGYIGNGKYSIFFFARDNTNVCFGTAPYGDGNIQTGTTNGEKWVDVKLVLKGDTGKADLTFKKSDADPITLKDVYLPSTSNNGTASSDAGFTHLRTLDFWAWKDGSNIYIDYFRVYKDLNLTEVTASVDAKVNYKDSIKVTFDVDDANLKDAVKLYNAEGTEVIPGTVTYASKVVTINPTNDLAKGATYKVVIDRAVLNDLKYTLTNANNVFDVLAHDYIVYEDYSTTELGGWYAKIGTGSVSAYDINGDGTNYAAAVKAAGSSTEMAYELNNGLGIEFEDGKNVVLEMRVKKSTNNRAFVKMNLGEPFSNGSSYPFITSNSGEWTGYYTLFNLHDSNGLVGTTQSSWVKATDRNSSMPTDYVNNWLDVKITFKGTTGKADAVYTSNGQSFKLTDEGFPLTMSSTVPHGFTKFNTLSFRPVGAGGAGCGETILYVDYLKVKKEVPVKATVAASVKAYENINVVFDKNNSALKDAVKLYNADGTEEIPATYTYDALTSTVVINPDSDLVNETNYKVIIDKAVVDAMGYALETNEFVVKASKYIINEDYGENDFGGWELLNPGKGALSAVLVDGSNYAMNMNMTSTASTTSAHVALRKINGDAGVTYEDGKNVVIEIKFKTDTQTGRYNLKLNADYSVDEKGSADYSLTYLFPSSSLMYFPNNGWTHNNDFADQTQWITARFVIEGKTGNINSTYQLGDNTPVNYPTTNVYRVSNWSSFNKDALKTLSFRNHTDHRNVLVDYLRVYEEYKLGVVVPELIEPGKTIQVKLDGNVDETIADYIELYDETGSNKIATVNTFDANTKTVTLTYETGFENGQNYVIKINKTALAELSYLVSGIADSYAVEVSNYIINDDFEDESFTGWTVQGGAGIVVSPIDEKDGQSKALVFSDTTNADDNQVAVRTFATPIAPRDGHNTVIETRIKHTNDAARPYFKVNIQQIGAATELGGNNYTLFQLANLRDGIANIQYSAGIAKNATNNANIKAIYSLAESKNTDTWFHVKALFDGTNQAILTITNETTGETETVTADFDSWPAAAPDYSTLKNVALRARTGSDDVYLDYVRVYYEPKETTTPVYEISVVDTEGNVATSISGGSRYFVKYDIDANDTDAVAKTAVIIALYRDGDLIDVRYEELKSRKNHNRTAEGVEVPEGVAEYKVKAFLWNTVEGMVPYVDPITLNQASD